MFFHLIVVIVKLSNMAPLAQKEKEELELKRLYKKIENKILRVPQLLQQYPGDEFDYVKVKSRRLVGGKQVCPKPSWSLTSMSHLQ